MDFFNRFSLIKTVAIKVLNRYLGEYVEGNKKQFQTKKIFYLSIWESGGLLFVLFLVWNFDKKQVNSCTYRPHIRFYIFIQFTIHPMEGFDESFNIGVLSGQIDVQSLRLKANAFNKFGLPFVVQEGFSLLPFTHLSTLSVCFLHHLFSFDSCLWGLTQPI